MFQKLHRPATFGERGMKRKDIRNLNYFIEDVFYKETSLSDHKMVLMRMNFKDEIKGPGVWILNTDFKKQKLQTRD